MDTSVEAPLSPEVVTTLVGKHREFLAFLQKRLGDRALAEDILQEAFVRGLHKLDGLAMKDYATEAGITSNNAAVRVFRAREALRKQVTRSCGTCADHGCLDCTCDKSAGHCH